MYLTFIAGEHRFARRFPACLYIPGGFPHLHLTHRHRYRYRYHDLRSPGLHSGCHVEEETQVFPQRDG